MEWTFDPLEPRNAHFNLNRLGAICRRYQPNLYGVTTSPLHRGLPTDRLVAEWQLDAPRVVALIEDSTAPVLLTGPRIELPAELDEWKKAAPDRLATLQARIRQEFTDWFSQGYAAVGISTSDSGWAYVLQPGAAGSPQGRREQ